MSHKLSPSKLLAVDAVNCVHPHTHLYLLVKEVICSNIKRWCGCFVGRSHSKHLTICCELWQHILCSVDAADRLLILKNRVNEKKMVKQAKQQTDDTCCTYVQCRHNPSLKRAQTSPKQLISPQCVIYTCSIARRGFTITIVTDGNPHHLSYNIANLLTQMLWKHSPSEHNQTQKWTQLPGCLTSLKNFRCLL